MAGDFVDAVQFKVEQFPDPQPAGTLQPQGGRGQLVSRGLGQGLGEAPVDVNGQITRQRLREPGDVLAEEKLAPWRFGPVPLGDVGQEAHQREHPPGPVGRGDGRPVLGVQGVDHAGER